MGLCPRLPLGELTVLPRPPRWIYGVLLLREGQGKGGKVKEGDRREGTIPPPFLRHSKPWST